MSKESFWEALEKPRGKESYFGPFHALAMYRGRGGEDTAKLREARKRRVEIPEAPGHWLEFYSAFLDTFAAHHGSSTLKRSEVFSYLQDGVTAIPREVAFNELNLLQRMYQCCLGSTSGGESVDVVVMDVRCLFIEGIAKQDEWITANQDDFLIPVIMAHFLWAMKKQGITVQALYSSLREEHGRGGPYSEALKNYSAHFIKHLESHFGYWGSEESFFNVLKKLASYQFSSSPQVEGFYKTWNESGCNVIKFVEPDCRLPRRVRDLINIIAPDENQTDSGEEETVSHDARPGQAPAVPTAPHDVAYGKTPEEFQQIHHSFWGMIQGNEAPFSTLSHCRHSSTEAGVSQDQKECFFAKQARKAQAHLPWSFFEIFDTLLSAIELSMRSNQALFDETSRDVSFSQGVPPQNELDGASVLFHMHVLLSEDGSPAREEAEESPALRAARALGAALEKGFHDYSRSVGYQQYDQYDKVMTFFATAQMLYQLSKEGVDFTSFLSHLTDETLQSQVALYGYQFFRHVDYLIVTKDDELSELWLAKALMGNLRYSQELYQNWEKSDDNSIVNIKERLGELSQQQQEEEEVVSPLVSPKAVSQPPAASSSQASQQLTEPSQKDPRTKYFENRLTALKAQCYWTPVRIVVSVFLPFMAIWFAIESCLNRHVLGLREKALGEQQTVGRSSDSAFRKPRHLHHEIWVGLTACCRTQPVETESIKAWNSRGA